MFHFTKQLEVFLFAVSARPSSGASLGVPANSLQLMRSGQHVTSLLYE
jgi:hypothetical protein